MPTYKMSFKTTAGWVRSVAEIDVGETLRKVMPKLLGELEAVGYVLEGRDDGQGDVSVRWQGGELDQDLPLPEQGVVANDVLRVEVKEEEPLLQLRREGEVYEVFSKTELEDDDLIIVGRTFLTFHERSQRKKLSGQHTTFFERFQENRSFKQTAYYMALVGGAAGLCSWLVVTIVLSGFEAKWIDVINLATLGGFIGGLSVGFSDKWFGDKIKAVWILAGVCVGALAGAGGGAFSWLVKSRLGDQYPLVAHELTWLTAGALIGFGVSLRWLSINRTRVLHGLVGGLFGGILAGLIYLFFSRFMWPDAAQALSFALLGAGITLGISLAPILLRQGVLEFYSSGDRDVQRKYGRERTQWPVHDGGKYVIGSLSASHTHTYFAPAVQIFIPDDLIADRHALLTSSKGKYYIEPHPEFLRQTAGWGPSERGM